MQIGANVEPHLSARRRSCITWEILGNRYCISYWLSFARHKGPIHPHAIACIGTDPDFQHASHRFAPSSPGSGYLLARSTSLDRGKRIISGVRAAVSQNEIPIRYVYRAYEYFLRKLPFDGPLEKLGNRTLANIRERTRFQRTRLRKWCQQLGNFVFLNKFRAQHLSLEFRCNIFQRFLRYSVEKLGLG